MSDTVTPDAIIEQARDALDAIDNQIAAMRQQKRGLGQAIAIALESRKPLARIVAAAEPRASRRQSNGE